MDDGANPPVHGIHRVWYGNITFSLVRVSTFFVSFSLKVGDHFPQRKTIDSSSEDGHAYVHIHEASACRSLPHARSLPHL